MNKIDLVKESLDNLILIMDKGATNVYFYRESGIPKYDVHIQSNGTYTKKDGRAINLERELCDELAMQLSTMYDKLSLEVATRQGELF